MAIIKRSQSRSSNYVTPEAAKRPASSPPIDSLSALDQAEPRYPRGWLSVVAMVFVITGGAAVWMYEKSDEWQVEGPAPAATSSVPTRMPEHTIGAAVPPADATDNQIDNAARSPLAPVPSGADNDGKRAEVEKPSEEPSSSEMSPIETSGDQHAPSSRSKDSAIQIAASASRTYTIQRGDTLSGIAARHYGEGSKWAVIARANPGMDPQQLKVGEVITLPDSQTFEKQLDYQQHELRQTMPPFTIR